MYIRNVTTALSEGGEETIWGVVFKQAFLEHTLPFFLILTIVLLTLIPCCLLTCRSKKRSRLSIIADSENTEELAGLRFEDLGGETVKRKEDVCDGRLDETVEPGGRRNVERWARVSAQFTRLESIDEEGSRTSSLKSNSTIGDLADTVDRLKNSLHEKSGGHLNEEVSKQLEILTDKIKYITNKNRQQIDYAENDSGMALLIPRSNGGLTSVSSYESNEQSNDVGVILDTVRVEAEVLKSKIEKKLKDQKLDKNVLAIVEYEISQGLEEMLHSIPLTTKIRMPKLGIGPSRAWSNVVTPSSPIFLKLKQMQNERAVFSPINDSNRVIQEDKHHNGERKLSENDFLETIPWCPKSNPSREPSPADIRCEETSTTVYDNSTLKEDILRKNVLKNTPEIQFQPMEKYVTKENGPDTYNWCPRPKPSREPSPIQCQETGREAENPEHVYDNVKGTQDLQIEDHGLWELEMAMIGMKEDIDRSIEIHTPIGEKKTIFHPAYLPSFSNDEVKEKIKQVNRNAEVDTFIVKLYNNVEVLSDLNGACRSQGNYQSFTELMA